EAADDSAGGETKDICRVLHSLYVELARMPRHPEGAGETHDGEHGERRHRLESDAAQAQDDEGQGQNAGDNFSTAGQREFAHDLFLFNGLRFSIAGGEQAFTVCAVRALAPWLSEEPA